MLEIRHKENLPAQREGHVRLHGISTEQHVQVLLARETIQLLKLSGKRQASEAHIFRRPCEPSSVLGRATHVKVVIRIQPEQLLPDAPEQRANPAGLSGYQTGQIDADAHGSILFLGRF
jgi:hypothetical protein